MPGLGFKPGATPKSSIARPKRRKPKTLKKKQGDRIRTAKENAK